MVREKECLDLGAIADAFRNDSREIGDRSLTKALLQTAHVYGYTWGAVRHAVLPSEREMVIRPTGQVLN